MDLHAETSVCTAWGSKHGFDLSAEERLAGTQRRRLTAPDGQRGDWGHREEAPRSKSPGARRLVG